MIRLMLSLVVLAALWASSPTQADAQALCGERADILETLERTYGEKPQAIGLSQDGGLVEVLVSPSGGWTLLITYPKRPSCVIATGQGWESAIQVMGQPT